MQIDSMMSMQFMNRFARIALAAAFALSIAGGLFAEYAAAQIPPLPACGNNRCEGPIETEANCPSDCGPQCGDGLCEGAETSTTCPADCGGGGTTGGGLTNPLRYDTIESFLRAILQAVILIAFPIIVLFMVYAGFKFIAAQGNPAEIAKARQIFLWTLIGALLILGAQALSYAIEATITQIQK